MQQVKVRLHGALAARLGRALWRMSVRSVAEALRALEANTGKLYQYLGTAENGSAPYRVLVNGEDHKNTEDLQLERQNLRTIDIIPVLAGAGSGGVGKIIIGVLLIIVAVILIIASKGSGTPLALKLMAIGGAMMMSVGLSLLFAGIAELLTKNPKKDPAAEKEENRPSYVFGGAINTTKQGNAVPVGYGRLRVGSQVISAGVRTFDVTP